MRPRTGARRARTAAPDARAGAPPDAPRGAAVAGRPGVPRAPDRGTGDRGAQDRRGHGRGRARRAQRPGRAAGDRGCSAARCDPAVDPVDRGAVRAGHRRGARRRRLQARLLAGVQGARRVARGPAAVLVAYAAALVYFALAGSLPDLGDRDATAIVSGAVGMLALAACTFALLPARDELPALI